MSVDNVYSFGNRVPDTQRRADFLTHAAAGFDEYVEANGFEPEALFTVFCGAKQPSRSGWLVTGESEGGVTSCLALAAASLNAACVKFDDIG